MLLILMSFPIPYDPEPVITDYPAVLSIYDPDDGGINCDGDCTTVATGPLTPGMYFTSGACPMELLGATITFHDIDETMECVDTGGAIVVGWSPYYEQTVVYFDFMWDADNPPEWAYWLIQDWSVSWDS